MMFALSSLVPLAAAIVASTLIMLAPEGSIARALGGISLVLLPGLAWMPIVAPEVDRTTRWTVGLGLSVVLIVIAGLALHFLPGPIHLGQQLAVVNGLVLTAVVARAVRRQDTPMAGKPGLLVPLALLGILLVAALFRLVNVGYSEFQGDEIKVMVAAASALEGQPDALLLERKKGPGEILPPMLLWGFTGTTTEGSARLPFALMGLLLVATTYLLGRDMAGRRAGLLAALFVALNGMLVAFSRIVQYQVVVATMSALALLASWHWRNTLQQRWAVLAAAFLAVGFLAHYDALTVVPVLVLVVLNTATRRRHGHGPAHGASRSRTLLLALACFAAIASLFYIPYLLAPQIDATAIYLGERIGAPALKNELDGFIHYNIFYGSFWYLLVTGLLVLAFTARAFHALPAIRRLPGSRHWVPLLIGAAALILVWQPEILRFEAIDLAGPVVAAVLLASLAAPMRSPAQREVFLWLAVTFVGYNFLIADPRTHIYTIAIPWSLIAGVEAATLWTRTRVSAVRYGALFAAATLLAAVTGYLATSYLRTDVEYWQDWPASQNALTWAPTRYQTPPSNIFGLVHNSGWKAAGSLYESQQLTGSYDSNEKPGVSQWYMRNAPRLDEKDALACGRGPTYFLIVDDVVVGTDNWRVDEDELAEGYTSIGRWEQANGKGISVYGLPGAATAAGNTELETLAQAFDRSATPAAFLRPAVSGTQANISLAELVRLVAYDVRHDPEANEVDVTLYWRADQHIQEDFHVFVHVEDLARGGKPSRIWGQSDRTPGCDRYPTSEWQPGQLVADRHVFQLVPDIPPGEHDILVGMYRLADGSRLEVLEGTGTATANYVRLGAILVPGP